MSTDTSTTYGAVAIGALSASLLSGAVAIQTILYYKLYPSDSVRVKILVFAVWLLDTSHTGFVWTSLWYMVIGHYGNINVIPWSIAVTIVITAVLTFLVHCFFAYRIFMLSKRNWFLICPIMILAAFRLASACVTTSEMIRLKTYSTFKEDFRWVFTLGLALSSTVDILITGSLFGLLHTSRSEAENLNAVIDSLILYTFETGSLTCAATIIDMICVSPPSLPSLSTSRAAHPDIIDSRQWLTMSSNLIFMGVHFVIGKLYANSLLVTLNTRRGLRRGQTSSFGRTGSAILLDSRRPRVADLNVAKRAELQISVERSVHYSTDCNVKLGPRYMTSQESISMEGVR
ncbi:uncharacterized protein BT62DRAFT_699078 [Guyanagaster necrorhizus]|uniref:DUF6534 domain-containing protein n=1 Tax=Guyanagaster necrorhizus TaxID=856835 RepID=A0A9P7VG74_9AGAR|nr:uncharacterized protein BT62DRAFT_699078 [Guyanagaster necrorhizus MCA 3950]KAG7439556.1 hypothetical protein BT62DRAFT_699078 [Guyanagaster necrorhizus MCA 3950]